MAINKNYKIKNYKKKKNKDFFFGLNEKSANIYLRKTFTNIFLTLTDIKNKVIICKTPTIANNIRNKRKKIIPYALDKLVYNLSMTLNKYEIKSINIIMRKLKNKLYLKFLVRNLKLYGYIINNITILRIISHNGVRKRKLKRL